MNDDQLHDAELRRLAQRLGTAAADRMDVEQTAAAVLRRLRADARAGRNHSSWWVRPVWLRVAAALVLMVGGGLLLRHRIGHPHAAHYVADDLRDLSADELRDVLGSLDRTLAQPSSVEPTDDDLNGLTTEQLERLLESLEG